MKLTHEGRQHAVDCKLQEANTGELVRKCAVKSWNASCFFWAKFSLAITLLNFCFRFHVDIYIAISIKVVPKKREKVEYERERLIGKD